MTDQSRITRALELGDLLPLAKPGDPATPGWGGVDADYVVGELLKGGLGGIASAVANILLKMVDEERETEDEAVAEWADSNDGRLFLGTEPEKNSIIRPPAELEVGVTYEIVEPASRAGERFVVTDNPPFRDPLTKVTWAGGDVTAVRKVVDAPAAPDEAHRAPVDHMRCEWRGEAESEDGAITYGPECGKPAEFISCVPFTRTPTCAEHKCRCAKAIAYPAPISSPGEELQRQVTGIGDAGLLETERLKCEPRYGYAFPGRLAPSSPGEEKPEPERRACGDCLRENCPAMNRHTDSGSYRDCERAKHD